MSETIIVTLESEDPEKASRYYSMRFYDLDAEAMFRLFLTRDKTWAEETHHDILFVEINTEDYPEDTP